MIVDEAIRQRTSTCSCTRLFVWLGPINASSDLALDWPDELERSFCLKIQEFLKSEHVGGHDLCRCVGLAEPDILSLTVWQRVGSGRWRIIRNLSLRKLTAAEV